MVQWKWEIKRHRAEKKIIMLLVKKEVFTKSNMGCRSPLYAESLLAARIDHMDYGSTRGNNINRYGSVGNNTLIVMRSRTPE